MAGASGASTTDDVIQPSDETVDGRHEGGEAYSVKFIQLTSDASDNANLTLLNSTIGVNTDERSFALKREGLKKSKFQERLVTSLEWM